MVSFSVFGKRTLHFLSNREFVVVQPPGYFSSSGLLDRSDSKATSKSQNREF